MSCQKDQKSVSCFENQHNLKINMSSDSEINTDDQGLLALKAIRRGDHALLQRLLDEGLDPRSSNPGVDYDEPWLLTAMRNGEEELMDLLLRRGADAGLALFLVLSFLALKRFSKDTSESAMSN